MARDGWFDGKGYELFQNIYEQRKKEIQEYWADGKIDENEINMQKQKIIDALTKIEPKLDDDIHAALTQIFIDWALFDRMMEYNKIGPSANR